MSNPLNIDKLLDKAKKALKADLFHIIREVKTKKLSDKAARDLVQYIKVLSDIVAEEEKDKKKMSKKSTEELKRMAKELLTDDAP